MHFYTTHTTHISACVRSNTVSERAKREEGGEGERKGGREGGREREEGREGGREGERFGLTHGVFKVCQVLRQISLKHFQVAAPQHGRHLYGHGHESTHRTTFTQVGATSVSCMQPFHTQTVDKANEQYCSRFLHTWPPHRDPCYHTQQQHIVVHCRSVNC